MKPCTIYHRKIETKNCHLSTYNISKHFSVFVLRLDLCPANSLSSCFLDAIFFNDCEMMWDDGDWSDTDDGGGDIVMRANDKCSKCLVKGRIHYHVCDSWYIIINVASQHEYPALPSLTCCTLKKVKASNHFRSLLLIILRAGLCTVWIINCDNYKVVSHIMFQWQRE